jgi:hypothetical protein
MHVVDLIRKKHDGGALADAEIAFLVDGAATDSIPEYQLSPGSWLSSGRAPTRKNCIASPPICAIQAGYWSSAA